MAVLAENSLYVKIRDSPFYEYFKQGMVVTLRCFFPFDHSFCDADMLVDAALTILVRFI